MCLFPHCVQNFIIIVNILVYLLLAQVYTMDVPCSSDIIDANVDTNSTNKSEPVDGVVSNPAKPVTVSGRTNKHGQTKVGDDQVPSSTTDKSGVQPRNQEQIHNSTSDKWKIISVILLMSIGALLAILFSRINVDQGKIC